MQLRPCRATGDFGDVSINTRTSQPLVVLQSVSL
jgi:hypothetical protein